MMDDQTSPGPNAAQRVVDRLMELGKISDEPGMLTRTFFSPAMAKANARVKQWMEAADLHVAEDDWGNIIGRRSSRNPAAKTLLMGSHLDTVRNAGRYDGPMGVLLGLAVCEELQREGIELPFHVDVLGFSDEEGVRFHSTYLGSKAVAGLITEHDLALRDEAGTTLGEVVGGPSKIPQARYAAQDLLGYIEAHLEQGPVLEAEKLPLGIVTAIAAQGRYTVTMTGQAGHAGTTPMTLRQDALTGAAEFISLVEKQARATAGLVATVGQIKAEPNVSNVIAQTVVLSLDIRHAEKAVVASALEQLTRELIRLGAARGLRHSLVEVQSSDSVACDSALSAKLADAVGKEQAGVPHLISGAGHDGVILSRLAPIAMLFVRCRKGLSHHPDEFVAPDDIACALRALTTFIRELA
jgi:allantoate deiminase